MEVTAADIEFEHKRALASLTPAQRKALARLQKAAQCATFNHHTSAENLRDIFEAEAVSLSRTESQAA
jgi:hypothetical protein